MMTFNHTCILLICLAIGPVSIPLASQVRAQDETTEETADEAKKVAVITAIRIEGPSVLNHGANLVAVKVRYEGKNDWKFAKPDEFQLTVAGESGSVVPDISREPVNPVLIQATAEGEQEIVVRVLAGSMESEKRFPVTGVTAQRKLSITVDADSPGHAYTGMGAGLMFYDNQLTIDKQLFDWCFKDVDTRLLHILIRPEFETVNDNDDWQVLNEDGFEWEKSNRLFWMCWNAKQRNPNLKVYACLYSPPAWMKANDDTAGDAGLKEGEEYKLEMAEYVYAFLKRAAWKGTKIDYLCLFNEPDFPHRQDGTYYPSLVELAQTHAFVRERVDQLIDADPDFNHKPVYVFPETLGPGSITRAGADSKALAGLAADGLLEHLGAWGVHDYWRTGGNYWSQRYRELSDFPGVGDRPIWMTEWAQRYSRGDLASSMEYGQKILNALRTGASAWLAFEWAHPAPNQSGLISTQWGEGVPEKRFWRSKSYYVFKQIANTTPADGNVVPIRINEPDNEKRAAPALETLAVRKDGRLTVQLLNHRNQPFQYEAKIANEGFRLIGSRTTTPTSNDIEIDPVSSGELPPYSLTTLIYQLEE